MEVGIDSYYRRIISDLIAGKLVENLGDKWVAVEADGISSADSSRCGARVSIRIIDDIGGKDAKINICVHSSRTDRGKSWEICCNGGSDL